jgi:sensor histidine kinase YesM
MILQPFVENAIIHGLEPKENNGILEVDIQDDGDNILILIKDNGIGMKNETLAGLSEYEESSQNTSKGTGVANVVRRLEIEYGKKIVDIQSVYGYGTKVTIRLPKQIVASNILEG